MVLLAVYTLLTVAMRAQIPDFISIVLRNLAVLLADAEEGLDAR